MRVSQTTKGMGVYVNADGMKCIDDAIWEADTIDPGTTPLKWKLGYGEASNSGHLSMTAVTAWPAGAAERTT